MAEEVLGVYPCLVKKLPTTVYITTDRMIMHSTGTAIEEAQVVMLSSVSGFMLNKPRQGLPPAEQKTLIKIQFREAGSLEMTDRVIDFTGDDRFSDILKCEDLLKERAGDKAEERRVKLKKEAEKVTTLRTQFLEANPDVHMMFEYLTSPEGGGFLPDEFWEQYKDQLVDMDKERSGLVSAVPAPLRRPDMIQNDVSANILIQSAERKNELNVTAEKAEEIFTQFPKAKELYDQFVPTAISEKNFWKRFFQSQYFNINQGHTVHTASAPGTTKDTIFDSMNETGSRGVPQVRPGEILVNPEIDLSTDWSIADSGVFSYRENGSDASQKVETSGKVPPKESVPHSALIRRFNEFSATHPPLTTEEDLISTLRKRIDLMSSSDPEPVSFQTETLVSKSEIERLRTQRAEITESCPSWEKFSLVTTPIVPGADGVAGATIELTTELVSPLTMSVSSEVSRRIKKLSTTDESRQLDDYVDRVCELIRFFYSCKIADTDKRSKLIVTLNKLKNDINNSFVPKAKYATDWMSTVTMLNGMISNIEIVNANIS